MKNNGMYSGLLHIADMLIGADDSSNKKITTFTACKPTNLLFSPFSTLKGINDP